MSEPNFNAMLWIILILWVIKAVCDILAGAYRIEKETRYGTQDVIAGLVTLAIVGYIILG